MTPEQFCYWLNGFCELSTQPPTIEQWTLVREQIQKTARHQKTPSGDGGD